MAIGSDRVQVLKQESASLGGNGADAVDWPQPLNPQQDALESAGLYLQDAGNRDANVYVERNGSDMRFRDLNNPVPVTLTDLLGVTTAHETIDSLVHNLAETCFTKVTRASGKPTAVVVWTSPGMTTKVRETLLTYTGGRVTGVVEKQYNGAGVLVQTLTSTITYASGQVDSITTTET